MAKKRKPQPLVTVEAFFTYPLEESKEKDAMKHPDYRALGKIMEHLEHSPKTRRLLRSALWVAALFALRLPDLITAIRWW